MPIGTPDGPAHEVRRVVSRLDALGPARLAGEASALVHRTLQRLADLAAAQHGDPRRPVPVLADHALASQLTVLVGEIDLDDDVVAEQVQTELVALRRQL